MQTAQSLHKGNWKEAQRASREEELTSVKTGMLQEQKWQDKQDSRPGQRDKQA